MNPSQKPFKFVPEDFAGLGWNKADQCNMVTRATTKLYTYLASCPVVYGVPDGLFSESPNAVYRNGMANSNTHRAVLMNIEPLVPEKCEYEPQNYAALQFNEFKCKKCGAKLKATWSEA